MSPKPNFLVVGAAKSGTTSLFEYLRHHPDIFMSSCKEISYFAGRPEKDIISLDEYLEYFSKATERKRIGEASVAYLYQENVPQKIASTLGRDIKIIIILRNPVDMSYSLWGHNTGNNNENLSYIEAVTQQDERLASPTFKENINIWLHNYAYINRAIYAPQVRRYLNVFGRKNVKIYIFEEFFKYIDSSLADIYSFLEIPPYHSTSRYKKYNTASKVRSKYIHKFYSEKHILTDIIRQAIPTPMRRSLVGWLHTINSKSKRNEQLDAETRKIVQHFFQQSIYDLQDLLEIDLEKIWGEQSSNR
jgi:hypothetical protein